ncbi:MAG TPA: hypothetical protein VNO55_10275 [Polyangia bacterium]|nr:hypothetical protein [Polyangia bacterium]
MTTRSLKVVVATLALGAFGFGCSSSSSSNDGGDAGKKDASGDTVDAPKDTPASDTPVDRATTDTPASDATDGPVLSPAAARGKYLVNAIIGCSDCHTPPMANGMPNPAMFLAGNPNFVVLPNGDKLGTRNLTNDPTGLKNRTDQEIKDMFLNGVRPAATGAGTADGGTDGGDAGDAGSGPVALNPIMPYYIFHNMTGDDADAIVAYLRTVPAVSNMIPRRGASFDVPMPAPALDLNAVKSPKYADSATQESALRGKYLTSQIGLCVECHTKHLDPGAASVLDEANLFAGGEDFSPFFATTLMIKPVSKNLTGDNTTGLGMWMTMDVKNCLLKGKSKDGTGICPPMPLGVYMNMTDGDATDIANYIKSLPAIVHNVPDMCVFPPVPPEAADGGAPETAAEVGAEAGVEVGDEAGG